ncbi:MAG: peptidase M19, partial [Rhodothermales bacterium]|nr:peptidase M19 [Rhodothermales bacterium]
MKKVAFGKAHVFRAFGALLFLASVVMFTVVPPWFDGKHNSFEQDSPYQVSPTADSLHRSLFVLDLHSDQLLWNRRTELRSDRGHVDVPRLLDGNVSFQVFSAVTKSPFGQNSESNPSD